MTNWLFLREILLKNIQKIIIDQHGFAHNYSKISQKIVNIWNNDIAAASDHAALRVAVNH